MGDKSYEFNEGDQCLIDRYFAKKETRTLFALY